MNSEFRPQRLWGGRSLALLGIMVVALNLRTSVAALSPIFSAVNADIPLGLWTITVLGILPPAAFAVGGLLAPGIARGAGLERSVVVAMTAAAVGHLARSLSFDASMLITGTIVGLVGMGIANVLLPPVVKRYFPSHIALITSIYAVPIAVSTALPPLIAAPIAASFGWRISLGSWAVLAIVGAVPWIVLNKRLGLRAARTTSIPGLFPSSPESTRKIWRSPMAWALGGVFSISAMNAYAIFAWLPELLKETAGVDSAAAGALLSMYAAVGIPLAVIMPWLTVRMKNPLPLMLIGICATIIGNLGLLLAPGIATWAWVAAAGVGPLLFPVCLTLINLRTRTEDGSAALSGFAQGIGYVLGAIGPIAFGALRYLTGGWTAPLLFLTGVAGMGVLAAIVVARPRYLEDSTAEVAPPERRPTLS